LFEFNRFQGRPPALVAQSSKISTPADDGRSRPKTIDEPVHPP